MIKVNYDSQTGLVKGYYPNNISYQSIPEPFFEIDETTHFAILGKKMCYVNGSLTEYIPTDSENLSLEKEIKLNLCKQYLNQTDWYIIRLNDSSSAAKIPDNIILNRANARKWQHDIEACQTLNDLAKINILWQ